MVTERKETEKHRKEICRHGLKAAVRQNRLVPPGDPEPKALKVIRLGRIAALKAYEMPSETWR